jgi:hypothetical protein
MAKGKEAGSGRRGQRVTPAVSGANARLQTHDTLAAALTRQRRKVLGKHYANRYATRKGG